MEYSGGIYQDWQDADEIEDVETFAMTMQEKIR